MSGKRKKPGIQIPLPSKDDILEFIQTSPQRVGKREIYRAFNIRGGAKIPVKRMLREMTDEGLIDGPRKRISRSGTLPSVTVIEILSQDPDGDYVAAPVKWDETHGPKPKIIMLASALTRSGGSAAGIGDRVLSKIDELEQGDGGEYAFEARPIKVLARDRLERLGIFRALGPGKGGLIEPIDRKELKEWEVAPQHCGEADTGELVRFEMIKRGRYGLPQARITKRLGNPEDQRQVSLIAIHRHDIPSEFPGDVLEEVAELREPGLKAREDLREVPLITIDPPDARDHDDAVHAAPDDDPANEGGHIVIVAIADVAHYVPPGSALDREALKRGNSVYFPDQVVPMLPERISNDLCSLRETEVRPCLAVRMVYDAKGIKRSHKFVRGLMRSAVKLSYLEAQAAIDGKPGDKAGPYLESVLKPLWAAYASLRKARDTRQPLELELPERKILLDELGHVKDVVTPPRLDAHKLIEEFMIQANVCAAETLEKNRQPLIYRSHDVPSQEKLVALSQFLATLKINLPRSGTVMPAQLNKILQQVKGKEYSELVNTVILRSQCQAIYSPSNAGHFGLNLRRYAHFTSPIRRYADLVIHRALIRALKLGSDGLSDREIENLDQTAENISDLERRAMAAERETVDRLIAFHLADQVGANFKGRIAGVTRSGMFVRLHGTGADGFIPASSIGAEYFYHDEERHAMVGERSGETHRLGDEVEVRLVEAIATAGALRFEILSKGRMEKPRKRSRPKHRGPGGRPKPGRRRR